MIDRTSGENIGDTGLIQSYRAWQAQYDSGLEHGSEYILPGLNFTRYDIGNKWVLHTCSLGAIESSYSSYPLLVDGQGTLRQNQLYVDALALHICLTQTSFRVIQVARVRTDPHSPNQYRVDGTVYNIPEFAKAFKCSAKAKVSLPLSSSSFHS